MSGIPGSACRIHRFGGCQRQNRNLSRQRKGDAVCRRRKKCSVHILTAAACDKTGMGFIRDRKELRTGYQEIQPWKPELDLQCDFVMVYGLDKTLQKRIDEYRSKGYEVHLMTGCAWGSYDDYLDGRWDGREHWDECQQDRRGEKIMHGVNIPYMVPTMNFAEYLSEKLCRLVDHGISAIHMEEPEFWDAGGYSPAFRREYEAFYGEPWQAPHTSVTARRKCSALKAQLYVRLVETLSRSVKEYSRKNCGRETDFYVASHSHINYTQWKIMSPGSRMTEMENIDGFIAQVWSGTSGTGNVYRGHYKKRTFETAYLEYGSMQELLCGTGKRMWFLQDPVEDFPEERWEDYRSNYRKTLTASLFWPKVSRYEICPWPDRVFNGRYPRKAGLADGLIPTTDMEGAKDIPGEYATMLSAMFQTLGNMEQEEWEFLGNSFPVGILVSDSSMHQRNFPDFVTVCGPEGEKSEICMRGGEDAVNEKILSLKGCPEEAEFYRELGRDAGAFQAYRASCAYPDFFGLVLPLLKHGLPVQPLYLEHAKAGSNYLSGYRYLILSYEYMKAESEVYNEILADWVRAGGCLIYVGDGSDPYHWAGEWWSVQYQTCADHLFALLGLDHPRTGVYPAGAGKLAVFAEAPAAMTLGDGLAETYREFVRSALAQCGYRWEDRNYLAMERGPYRIAAVMEESTGGAYACEGKFADLMEDGFPLVRRIRICEGQEGLFFDYGKIEDQPFAVIATAARIFRMDCKEDRFVLEVKAADRIHVHIRLRLPWEPAQAAAWDEGGEPVKLSVCWEEETRTALFSYDSRDRTVTIQGEKRK